MIARNFAELKLGTNVTFNYVSDPHRTDMVKKGVIVSQFNNGWHARCGDNEFFVHQKNYIFHEVPEACL